MKKPKNKTTITVLEESDSYILREVYKEFNRHSGCQCYKDCSCADDFKPFTVREFTVKKLKGKPRTKSYPTLEEAMVRVNFLKELYNERNTI